MVNLISIHASRSIPYVRHQRYNSDLQCLPATLVVALIFTIASCLYSAAGLHSAADGMAFTALQQSALDRRYRKKTSWIRTVGVAQQAEGTKNYDQLAIELVEEKSGGSWRKAMAGPNGEEPELEVRKRFRFVSEVLGSDELALEAFRRNIGLLVFDGERLASAFRVLQSRLGTDEAKELVRKNPAVLTIPAENLEANEDLSDVKNAANVLSFFFENQILLTVAAVSGVGFMVASKIAG
eukprot:TRINITY_DN114026_c0_g1_i1.p1 TRINITY_DN114026_c0_g1~~TRINITY_DN114026_c0_g1_i1.p1  ORF type:complete len:239 (+),score=41.87 TRINITY_DN114026_c0_g1_i1:27-743(+)